MPGPGGRIPLVVEREPEPQLRKMKIMKADYEVHGYTECCRGCGAMRRKAPQMPHTAACRTRVETMLATTPAGEDRLRQSADRIDTHVTRALEHTNESEQSAKRRK
eukprot:9858100-Heterocapsa_arctica.AAC.1